MQRSLFLVKKLIAEFLSSELTWQFFALISFQLVDRCLDDVHQLSMHNVYVVCLFSFVLRIKNDYCFIEYIALKFLY